VVGGGPEDTEYLLRALRQEGIVVLELPPQALSDRVAEIPFFDAVVLANVHAENVPPNVRETIARAVHDTGMGLLMIGGEHSFGPGGWRGTPLEEALPV
jgi:uncharacterized membrane protein